MPDNPIAVVAYLTLPVLSILASITTAIATVRIAIELRRWRLSTPTRLEGELRMLTRFVGIVAVGVAVIAVSSVAQLARSLLLG